MLPDQREALGVVEQGGEVQQARGRHGHHQTIEGNHFNRLLLLTLRSAHAGTTLESDKSLGCLQHSDHCTNDGTSNDEQIIACDR